MSVPRRTDEAPSAASWPLWLGWTWVALLLAAAVAELADLENLRAALDFQRHLR